MGRPALVNRGSCSPWQRHACLLANLVSQLPEADNSKDRQIREKQWRHGRRSVDKIVERMDRRPAKITHRVQHKSPKAHGGFEDQNRGANLDKPAGNVPEHRNTEKTNCSGAGGDGHPFHSEEKPIGCVICQTEGEIANEAAHGEQQYPSRPLDRFRIDHAIHDEKKP